MSVSTRFEIFEPTPTLHPISPVLNDSKSDIDVQETDGGLSGAIPIDNALAQRFRNGETPFSIMSSDYLFHNR